MARDLVSLSAFLLTVRLAGAIARLARASPLVGHLAAGAALGPSLAGFAPSPGGLELAGLLGVALAATSAGLCTDAATLRRLVLRAALVAVAGLAGPLVLGGGALLAAAAVRGEPRDLRMAAAGGAALAPTSLGVVARLLREAGEEGTELGMVVAAAAVVDDVLSLVLLALVVGLAEGGAWGVARPVVFSVVFVAGGVAGCVVAPRVRGAMRRVKGGRSVRGAGVWVLCGVGTAAVYGAEEAGTSFVLAAYVCGLVFSGGGVAETWGEGVGRAEEPLLMLFFAATVGFAVPVRVLFEPGALLLGAVLGVAGIVGKVVCGLAVGNVRRDGLAVGVAMLGRGEFGFLIAREAREKGLLEGVYFPAVIWGVLVPTLVAPWLFGFVFRRRKAAMETGGEEVESGSKGSAVSEEGPVPG